MDKNGNPGSKEAVDKGCTCPIMDNGAGRGYMGQVGKFWITYGCPLHTDKEAEEISDICNWVDKQPEEE